VFGRRQVRTHNEMMREEFNEGFDHLRMAAAHAAGSAAGVIAPRLDSMRERMEPTIDRSKSLARASAQRSADMARDSAERAGRMARRATGKKKKEAKAKRWSTTIGGLMIAGATVGAVGALLSRRRQRRWNEYGSTDTVSSMKEEARSIADSAKSTASSMTETAKDKASDVLGQMKSTTDTTDTTDTTTSATGIASAPSPTTRTGDYDTQSEAFKSGTGSTSRNSHQ
jgi:hypothetical protein